MHPRFGRWIHYEPKRPKEELVRAAVDKLWYAGHIARDDPYEVTHDA